MNVAGGILAIGVVYFLCFMFLFAFAHRLGITEETQKEIWSVTAKYALVITSALVVVYFLSSN